MVDKGPTWIGDALDIDRINSCRQVKQRTNELMPGFLDFLDELWGDALISHRAFAAYGPNQAVMIVTNQATNDLCDLMSEIDESRGRAAMRSARSLIEHMINLYEIVNNADACERYLAHIAVTHYVEATAAIGLNRLNGVEKKAEIHRLKKLERDSSKLVADAKRKYGSSFGRAWSTLNLRDMAKKHGLEMHYDFYRLASQVLHGSAGGRLGSMKVIDSWPVYRIGPALSLLPMALLEGVTAFRKIVDAMKSVEPLFDPAPLVDSLDTLFRAWPYYRRLMRELDRELWPDRVPEEAHAVLGISKQGTRRWFLYEPELGLLMKATPPNPKQLTTQQREQIERIIAKGLHKELPLGTRWFTIRVEGVYLVAEPNAYWFNAAGVLAINSNAGVSEQVGNAFTPPIWQRSTVASA